MSAFRPKLHILPSAQIALWPDLKPIKDCGFVLYGGTAIALRLGHRVSVDFDFFSAGAIDRDRLRRELSFLGTSQVLQDHLNTFEVLTESGIKVSFFGGLDFGRVGEPERTDDGVALVASLDDLMAAKVKVILQRSQAKDYQDIAAMARAGVSVAAGMAAAEKLFHPAFPVIPSIKALTFFGDGDLDRLSAEDRATLYEVSRQIRAPLPVVNVKHGLY